MSYEVLRNVGFAIVVGSEGVYGLLRKGFKGVLSRGPFPGRRQSAAAERRYTQNGVLRLFMPSSCLFPCSAMPVSLRSGCCSSVDRDVSRRCMECLPQVSTSSTSSVMSESLLALLESDERARTRIGMAS